MSTEAGVKFTSEIPKATYWTPDGRKVQAVANMHGTNKGTVRDANLDRGWLIQKPEVLKPYCPHCDNWHDTEGQVAECGARKRASNAKYQKVAEEESMSDLTDAIQSHEIAKLKTDITGIKTDMADIKSLLMKMMEGK